MEIRDEHVGSHAGAWLLAAYAAELNERFVGYHELPADGADFAAPGGAFVVAYHDGEPVGCAGLRTLRPGVGEIKRMYVRPAARGKGCARALLAELEARGRLRGHRVVRLDTSARLIEAGRLYPSAGYRRIDDYNANPHADVWFEKSLDGAHEPAGLTAARELWEPAGPYLNTPSYGLPPRPAFDAMQHALADWRHGRTSWEPWDASTGGARAAFARLVGVDVDNVAVGASVSQLMGLVAAWLPDHAHVVVPDIEFTSALFPFLAHADRGVRVTTVPPSELAASIDSTTTMVAFSAVQSATGEVAETGAIVAAARHHGAMVTVDATQACGWLPLEASEFDFCVCTGYKWLMSPRGTAFLTMAREHVATLRPLGACWYAGEDVHDSYYGPPLRLATTARRLDISPAWFSWVGTQPAIELVERLGVAAVHDHDVALANRFRAGLGLPPSNSAIVSADVPDAGPKLERTGIIAPIRAGRLRVGFHVYNTEADVDATVDALTG